MRYPEFVRSDEGRARWHLCLVEAAHRHGPPHPGDSRCFLYHACELFTDEDGASDELLAARRAERDAGVTPWARLDLAYAQFRQTPFPVDDRINHEERDVALVDAELASAVSSLLQHGGPNDAERFESFGREFSRLAAKSGSPEMRAYAAQAHALVALVAELAESDRN